jgi:hypothetical protein
VHESAYGTKRTSLVAPHMSAFGGKADICSDLAYCPLTTLRRWRIFATIFNMSADEKARSDSVRTLPSALRLRLSAVAVHLELQ